MKLMVFGATGRIGSAVVEQSLAAGHDVAVYVRDASRLKGNPQQLAILEGNVLDAGAVTAALQRGYDAVVVAIGADPLKPSTLVTDAARSILAAVKASGIPRYLGVSGTAEMPRKTLMGKLVTAVMRLTPVGNAIRDHDGAYALVAHSGVEYTLAGCPWVKDGPAQGSYKTSIVFPGGQKHIFPGDVAHFLVTELSARRFPNQIVGLWY